MNALWAYAQEWFNLKRYALHHKLIGSNTIFAGEMTNCRESLGDTCDPERDQDSWTTFDRTGNTFAPKQGWWSFYDALNRTISARYKLKNSLVLGDDFRVVQNTRVIPPSGPAFESGSFIDRLTYSEFPGGTKLNAFNIISSQQYLPSKIPVFRSTQQELAWSTDIGYSGN